MIVVPAGIPKYNPSPTDALTSSPASTASCQSSRPVLNHLQTLRKSVSMGDQQPIDWQQLAREVQLKRQVRDFQNDDEGYRTWLRAHPAGFVVNSSSVPPRDTAMIHTARCPHIAYGPWLDGADLASAAYSYTTSPNAKICADSERALIDYCRLSLHNGDDLSRCATCL